MVNGGFFNGVEIAQGGPVINRATSSSLNSLLMYYDILIEGTLI